jgi:hypothetical protein
MGRIRPNPQREDSGEIAAPTRVIVGDTHIYHQLLLKD